MLSLADLEIINDNLKLIANLTSKKNQLELSTDMKAEINNLDNDLAKINILIIK